MAARFTAMAKHGSSIDCWGSGAPPSPGLGTVPSFRAQATRKSQQTGVSILAMSWMLYIAEICPDNALYALPSIDFLQKAKNAHDELIAATHRAQADALEIEAQAKRRLADEYDSAQARGDVRKDGQRGKAVPDENSFSPAKVEDIGLTRRDVFDARQVRDAIAADPGVVRAALDFPQLGEELARAMSLRNSSAKTRAYLKCQDHRRIPNNHSSQDRSDAMRRCTPSALS